MDYYHLFPDKTYAKIQSDDVLVRMINAEKTFSGARSVGLTVINGIRISTVFLCIDHSFASFSSTKHDYTRPVMWECMIFGGKFDSGCWRASGSVRNARLLHIRKVKLVLAKEFNLVIKNNEVLAQAFDLGFDVTSLVRTNVRTRKRK